ncbi:DnaJ domain-containing protein [Thermoleptolyngbya sichuanensis XZ-Cy5]|uniref:J domain-containing protein n=1 Tax=Thermoleptolyngbya sichuanensis TaxID=2885951 RepID=UPI00240D2249|nr:DnaJ domain-containing protein [Thermoleptolyngbya sichuanensis]MDG2617263.1 DnaJ domain-containing protein [Thermoleptolyngbya sichuanensis XZ-Cy5]
MSFNLESGLFGLGCSDYHAVLGVPVDADPKDIRKKYLRLAQRLHPDSSGRESEEDRKRAAEFLSKLVNPAYEELSKEKKFNEHLVVLKLKGQQALNQQETILLQSDAARSLASAYGELDSAYRQAIKRLADEQYAHLDKTEEITGQISELNLVYLMRKAGKGEFPTPATSPAKSAAASTPAASPTPATGARPTPTPPAAKAPPSRESVLASYLRRAEEFETKQDYPSAVKELRDALQIAPKNGSIHSRLGAVYLRANQPTMAKIHFRKALELNPKDAAAEEGLRRVDPAFAAANAQAAKADAKAAKPTPSKPAPKGKPESGGGLFGLFGGKKK